ncbi:hypothetical protein P691DRAFT_607495, partial [Macrolepiota fuliginosa MF-IS2]
ASYRCLECFNFCPICASCIINQHVHQPFHHIQRWTGTHFKQVSLCGLGFVISLGHNAEASEFIVVHTNGVHQCCIIFCIC